MPVAAGRPAALPGTLAVPYEYPGGSEAPQHLDIIRRGKGGVVGTSGKGAISLRFDHKTDDFLATVWPLLKARALPATFAVVTDAIGNASHSYEPTSTSWATLVAQTAYGLEHWAHSRSHQDPADSGLTYEQEIVGSGEALEAQDLRCMGWMQCGAPATYQSVHTSAAGMDDLPGRMIRNTYGLFTSQIANSNRRILPTHGCWGYPPTTIDTTSLATLTGYLDQVVAWKTGIEFNLHADQLGEAGSLSLADFTTWLDDIEARREAGDLEVLTSTALAFADPGSTHRLDLIPYGDFETASTSVFPEPTWGETHAGSWTIVETGGHGGNNFLRVPSDKFRAACSWPQVQNYGLDGFAFIFDGWTRSVDGADPWVRILCDDVLLVEKYETLGASETWQHWRLPFTIPMGTESVKMEIGRRSGLSVDWDDVHIYAT